VPTDSRRPALNGRMIAALLLAAALRTPAHAGEGEPQGTLVLDECCYNRSFVQFGPDRIAPRLLKKEGARLLSDKALAELKREVRMVHQFMGKPWDESSWMDHACVLHRQGQAWDPGRHGRMNVLAATPPPPEHWTRPDFDDSGWPRLRGSLMVGVPPQGMRDDVDALGRRRGCFRYRFLVPDTAKAGTLALRLAYHGGARVFLNGQEIARGHLPQGELGPDTPGADYPLAAYVKLNADGSMPLYDSGRRKGLPFFLDDVYGSWDDAPAASGWGVPKEAAGKLKMGRHGRDSGVFFDPETWGQVQRLRDRSLGPLALPANLLRQGVNVLAVEVRASDLHPVAGGYRAFRDPFAPPYYSVSWFHAQLLRLELRCQGGQAPSMRHRPGGAQVWVEDIHTRVFTTDYSDLPSPAGEVRFVGAINGEYSAQLVVGTDRRLGPLRVAFAPLRQAEGAWAIPASALRGQFMVAHPVTEMGYLSRGGRDPGHKLRAAEAEPFLRRFGGPDLDVVALTPEQKVQEAERLGFFDHIAAAPPTEVPAGTCQPIWLTLRVPADAQPGLYRGSLRVEAEGMEPATVPVAADVIGWRVPDTPDWQIVMQIEQSPFAVAEHYNVPLWSDRHFALMEPSFRHLGRIGNDWVFIPVLWNTELGNLQDSPIRWLRRRDGSLAFDYAAMDRYLDLAAKHLGRPRVICFLVMHGGTNTAIQVGLLDEKAGKVEPHDVSGNSPTYFADWRAFGKSLYNHLRARGLERSMYWGYMWDTEGDPNLSSVLGQVAPEVWWASGGHGYGYRPIYRANSQIYGIPYDVESKKGWKRSDIFLLNPRGGGTVLGLSGTSLPAVYRVVVDRALVAGCNGVARIAADYWDNIYFRGCKAWHYLIPGMGVASHVLWPGPAGAESSQRFELLREGAQEGEARIFLEQALDRGGLPEELAQRARDALRRHNQENFFIPISASDRFVEYFRGWQERSHRLLAAAAEVAAVSGFDVMPQKLQATVPARGQARLGVALRNWTGKPRAWKARSLAPWIALDKHEGTASGHEELLLTLDATPLAADKPSDGKLVVTDVATGKDFEVQVAATVGPVLEFIPPDADTARRYFEFGFIPHKGKVPFDVAPGAKQAREVSVLNRSAASLRWQARASAPWIALEPASGEAPPQSPIVVRVTPSPPASGPVYHDAVLTVVEADGPARIEVPLAIHVVPPYRQPPAPKGEPVPLDAARYKELLKQYNGAKGAVSVGPAELGAGGELAKFIPKAKRFQRCVRGVAPYEATFNLQDEGFAAFSASVGFPDRWTGIVGLNFDPGGETDRVNYEIYVDGQLRAQSGFMGPKDDFRLLVVENLAGAKELRLVARPPQLPGYALHVFWFDPAFHKAP